VERPVAFRLTKRIPAAAGLGGGSSDAAAVLNGLNRMHGAPLGEIELHALAATLGSDVPFFLRGGCAVAEGRGERLAPKPPLGPLHAVLVCPPFGVETPWAYARVTPRPEVDPALSALAGGETWSLDALLPHMTNDLEPPVRDACPEIGEIERRLREAGAAHAMMTGSGSTVFGLFRSAGEAWRARGEMEGAGHAAYAVTSTECGSETGGGDG
jgi:4-diphosphocytidyl-2-C-methyl-D-erythritol kinase